MKLTRREFAKLSSFSSFALLSGCALTKILPGHPSGVDAVIAALSFAGNVALKASAILRPLSAKFADLLKTASDDLQLIVKVYNDYETAGATDTGKLGEINATIAAISNNLNTILTALHVFNASIIRIIQIAIAVVNTAIQFLINSLPAPHKAQAKAQRANLPPLPVIPDAKNANDLKKAWNQAVAAEHPEAVIQ